MIAARAEHVPSSVASDKGILTNMGSHLAGTSAIATDWLRQTLCGVRGHAMLLHFESERLSLQCMSCGRNTPGWVLGEHA